MKYKISWDEDKGVLYIWTYDMLGQNDVDVLMRQINSLLEDKEHRYILADVSESPTKLIDQEARRAYKGYKVELFDKIAIVGANPSTRMIAKVALSIIGKSDVSRFFKTEAQALAWLKDEVN